MKLCLRCGYTEGDDFPPYDPYGFDDWGCADWGIDGEPEFRIFGEAEGHCPRCGANNSDWVEGW